MNPRSILSNFWGSLQLMVHPSSTFAAVNNYVELKKYKIMAGLFLMFVMVIALGELVNDYLKELNQEEVR